MARILITKAVMISGDRAEAGSVVEVTDGEAQLLIGIGKAIVAADPEPEPAPAPEPKPARARKPHTED